MNAEKKVKRGLLHHSISPKWNVFFLCGRIEETHSILIRISHSTSLSPSPSLHILFFMIIVIMKNRKFSNPNAYSDNEHRVEIIGSMKCYIEILFPLSTIFFIFHPRALRNYKRLSQLSGSVLADRIYIFQ